MLITLNNKDYDLAYRPGTSDEIVINEASADIYNFRGIVKSGQEWIDAGANIGTSTLSILAYGGNILLGLEPDETNYNLYTDNLYRAGYLAIPTQPAGLAPPGQWSLDRNSEPWNYQLKPSEEGEVTQSIALEELICSGCHPCLKMDIEGMEHEIIMSTEREYLEKLEIIVMEYHHDRHTPEEFQAVVKKLTDSGFDLKMPEKVTASHLDLSVPFIVTAHNKAL